MTYKSIHYLFSVRVFTDERYRVKTDRYYLEHYFWRRFVVVAFSCLDELRMISFSIIELIKVSIGYLILLLTSILASGPR